MQHVVVHSNLRRLTQKHKNLVFLSHDGRATHHFGAGQLRGPEQAVAVLGGAKKAIAAGGSTELGRAEHRVRVTVLLHALSDDGCNPPRPHPATYRPCRASSSGGHPLSFFSSSWPFACIA